MVGGFGLLALAKGSSVTADDPVGFSAGPRWYAGGRRNLFVSLNFTDSVFSIWADYDLRGPTSPRFRGSLSMLTLVVGYVFTSGGTESERSPLKAPVAKDQRSADLAHQRWNLGAFFVEAGAGAGGYRERVPQTGTNGIGNAGKPSYAQIPDGVLSVGIELSSTRAARANRPVAPLARARHPRATGPRSTSVQLDRRSRRRPGDLLVRTEHRLFRACRPGRPPRFAVGEDRDLHGRATGRRLEPRATGRAACRLSSS